ncbi:MAG: DUF1330 domain-containing protein [Chloroflexi bacterium]|nr:DUF1330 domain-containing protein [Chloroflexota bacterium]
MPGYVIGQLQEIKNQDAFAAYQRAAGPSVLQYGGKLVIDSAKLRPADGGWSPHRVVMLEFESVEQAQKWYDSPEYQAVIGQRFSSADSAVLIIDGDEFHNPDPFK